MIRLCLGITLGLVFNSSQAQIQDSLEQRPLGIVKDSTQKDSLQISLAHNKSALEDIVEYEAKDSIVFGMKEQKARLYGNAWITFQDIRLEADYIEVDFRSKTLYATGIVNDSNNRYVGRPQFTDDGKVYEADTMKYNFESRKGLSMGVLTTEKDGYIHGDKVLRDSLENIYVKRARFTTCNLPDPHFYIQSNKIKVIPKKQIVTGPAHLVIENISTPLFVPFGFFPIPEKKAHGLIFPSFGESPDRGFYLRGLGYYFPINDYIDLQVKGDYYFRGSWGISANSTYNKRYKYRGNFSISYNLNEVGEPEIPSSYSVSNDIKVRWSYTQDAKAKPGSSFGANVNFVTSNYLKNNTINYNDIISTTSTSSINYGKSLFNNKLNLSVTSNIYQDLSRKDVDLTLPEFTANLGRQMPFSKAVIGNKTLRSFVRNFGFSYAGNFRNELKVKEESLFKREALDSFNNGVTHSIPLNTSFKALKWLTLSPSFQFKEYWYFKTTSKTWDPTDSTVKTDNTIPGFSRVHEYSTSISISTILYGYKEFKKGKLRAIRHVMRPRIGASWNPDFSTGEANGYFSVQVDTAGTIDEFSIYEAGILGRPRSAAQGAINFALGNNLEMKVRTAKDTANGGIKKIKLVESFNISTGYNFLADSINLRNISLSGNTTILNKIRIVFNGTLDPYHYDSTGGIIRKVNEYLWSTRNRLARLSSNRLTISTNLNPQAFKKKDNSNVNQDDLEFINNNLGDYIDFNIPWSLNLNYSLVTTNPFYGDKKIEQLITIDGDLSITENWKIGMKTGYDISTKSLALTSFDFYRNLHCWEFSFSWFPIIRQSFEFSLKVKSSTLQDLKLNRRRSWWDL
ncbi:MAG: LPS-assembly protein LptD [Bacteroidia bacterium]